MRLLNRSLLYLAIPILAILSIWSVVFYFNMLDEISDSIDDGLHNSKLLIIQQATTDSTLLQKSDFNESNYAIQEISRTEALLIRDRYSDTTLYMQHEQDKEPVRMLSTAFELNEKFYRLLVISSTVEEDDLIEDLLWSVVWLYLIMLAGILLINQVALQKLWKPFYEMLKQLKQFRLGSTEKPLDVKTGIKEFNSLKTAANSLIRHTHETYIQQKQFTENAAHELQTPLAIAAGKLELLLEKNDLTEAQAAEIGKVLQMTERLIRLNKSLLLLTKIENRQFSGCEPVSINQTVQQCLDEMEDIIRFRNVEISVEDSGQMEVKMDPALASILVSNLIKNAVFHNHTNGLVTITISSSVLSVSNTGISTALHPDQLFKRFYKQSAEQSGTGLGLAIVKAICHVYGLAITYQFKGNHQFEIRYKL